MAAVNKTTISTTLNAEIRTGLSDTTALGLRNLINQILDSYVNTKDGGLFYEQLVGYASLLTITDQKSFVHKKYVDDLIAAISSSQTLAQTLGFGNATNENVITSNNLASNLSIKDLSAKMSFNNGIGAGRVKIDELENIVAHDVIVKLEAPLIEVSQDPTTPNGIASKQFVEGLLIGLLDDRGSWDASTNLFPTTGGSGVSGAILKGDVWFVSVAGILASKAVTIGDSFRCLVDTPAQVSANWSVLETNIGYVPENTTNKQNSLTPDGSGIKFVTVDAVNAGLNLKVHKLITDFKTANYDMVLTDVGKNIAMNLAVANTFKIKLNATVNCPIDAEALISQYGIGQTQILKDVGVTLVSIGNADKIMAQGGAVAIKQVLTDVWFMWGALEQAGGSGLTQQIVEGLI